MFEFEWQLVCHGGTMLGGYDVYRCTDCSKCLYHLPEYGVLFIPTKQLNAEEDTLVSMLRMELHLSDARKAADKHVASIAFKDLPEHTQFYLQDSQLGWRPADVLRLNVPLAVSRRDPNPHLVHFFLHPPHIVKTDFV
ncbi:hypothetical protein A3C18_04070 [Candidatus Kaiserbacteria bacterium RIFCSPHIGHO2_02_FULL_54_11b]|uniref:Uncharacterized protein n=1 Tax=Candidatus Kaiserbacteria bacterium RIFCSPHIGHO2_02_FULL_54_11b TaxID=1798494 RepID=A0A1F6DST6_9BACT|nr:MAG: hypothetical protein A3C18_04070 [Candidatus Kaiserbacteria bacterium RIFCSPHIGHO2_02_FULL_54_11b]